MLYDEKMCLNKLQSYVESNKDIEYTVEETPLENQKLHRYVGAQIIENVLYGIPNHETQILKFHCKHGLESYMGDLSDETYKWTGGTTYNDKVYCFPRKACSLLVIDYKNDGVDEIPLEIDYTQEHHYGGVCTQNGIVYQPPRNNNHLLRIDLKDYSVRKIVITGLNEESRYCGTVIHPNGYIYFIPERDQRIIKMNIETEEVSFVGDTISTMCFEPRVCVDGNIYGFSNGIKGILKIDVMNNTAQMIKTQVMFGSYGTKMGINGKLYSVPGVGQYVWEYDVLKNELTTIFDTKDRACIKYAGGAINADGYIFGVPVDINKIIKYKPNLIVGDIPEEIRGFFCDFY